MRPLILLSASLLIFGCKPAPQVARYEVKSEAAPAAAAPATAPAAPVAAKPAPSPAVAAPMVAPASM